MHANQFDDTRVYRKQANKIQVTFGPIDEERTLFNKVYANEQELE